MKQVILLFLLISIKQVQAQLCLSNNSSPNYQEFATGNDPIDLTSADFNSDGIPDIAVARKAASKVSVLLSLGNGMYSAPTDFTVGSSPSGIVSSDFNNDGKTDLAVSNSGSNNISILLGNGSGGFASAINFNVGNQPSSIASADIDHDGKNDLVIANYSSNDVYILKGNGSGSFTTSGIVGASGNPNAIICDDINNDGNNDIATANYNTNNISAIYLTSTGAFLGSASISCGTNPYDLTSGDFNNDGKKDLAAVNYTSHDITISIGNPSGGFFPSTNISAGNATGLSGIIAGDFDSDSNTDIAIASRGIHCATILQGNGTGTFGTPVNYGTGTFPWAIIKADFNADGKIDIATANQNSNTISVLLGNGTISYTGAPAIPTFRGLNVIKTADLNNDGKQDLITANGIPHDVSIFIANSDGSYSSPTFYPLVLDLGGQLMDLCVADFNQDNNQDIVIGTYNNYTTAVLYGNGVGGIDSISYLLDSYNPGHYVTAGDFNSDSFPDIITISFESDSMNIFWNNGAGGFNLPVTQPFVNHMERINTVDVNSDGYLDLITNSTYTQTLSTLLNDGLGNFTLDTSISISTPTFVTTSDFNNDSIIDLAIINHITNNVSVCLGTGNGSFSSFGSSFPINGSNPKWIVSADFNEDGNIDVATANAGSNNISGLLGDGIGGFGTAVNFPTGLYPICLVASDLNGDGHIDIVSANQIGRTLTLITYPKVDLGPDISQCNGSALLNAGHPGSSYLWNDTSTYQTLSANQSGTYFIQLTTSSGCVISDTINVIIDECVWPGDCDYDLNATQNDLLPIGIHFNESGNIRPNANNMWNGQSSVNWSQNQLSGINLKHADCNGDGLINFNDTVAIHQNFGNAHAAKTSLPKYISTITPDAYIVFDKPFYVPGDLVNTEIHLGSPQNVQTAFYGTGFEINYNTSIIVPGSETFNFVDSWVGNLNQDEICFSKINNGTVYASLVKINHQDTSGNGKVANFRFTLKNSLSVNKLFLSITNGIKTDNTSNITPLISGSDSANIMLLSISLEDASPNSLFRIYPNPAENSFTIDNDFDISSSHTISICNVLGQTNFSTPLLSKRQNIDISSLPKGLYFITIYSKTGKSEVVKLIKD